jgi:hypothetical protein
MQCVHCRARKGKRDCPALGGKICSACCGEYRLVKISCPSDCVYLESHQTYQRRRTFERAPRAWLSRVVRYDRQGGAAQVVMHAVQVAACEFQQERGSLDRESLREGLEFARRKMSLIETPEPYVPPLGDFLVKKLDALIQDHAPVEREGVRQVLEETLRHIEDDVPDDQFPEFLTYLRALYADHLKSEGASRGSLILPR